MTLPRLPLLVAMASLLLLAACSPRDAEPAATPTPAGQPSTPTPAVEATAVPTASPTEIAGPAEELEALVLATIPGSAMRRGDGLFGFDGVFAFPLDQLLYEGDGAPWGVATTGRPGRFGTVPHFVAVYLSRDGGWEKVDRIELPEAEEVLDGGVRVIDIEPSRYWIEVDSFVRNRGGYYELLSYDGRSLRSEVSGFGRDPIAGESRDVNDDGILEVLLDASGPYMFCEDCGVIDVYTGIYRWDGSNMILVELETVDYDDDVPVDDPILANNAAVGLAHAYRWKEALALVDAHDLRFEDGTIGWNAWHISVNANEKLSLAREASFPFLQHVFAGDFDAAYEVLRQFPPQRTFTAEPAFLDDTAAEDFGDIVSSEVLAITGQARFSEPERASIIAVHAWALFVANPGEPQTLAELQAALALTPDDTYLAAAVAYLTP